MPRPFFIDSDTGSDDAVALLIALTHPGIEVVGIGVVAGNVPLELGVQNALYTRELCGRLDVPIYAGDLGTIEQNQPITVKRLGDLEAPMAATRVTAPLRGDATAASVDLTYVIQQRRGTLRPGERVLVEVPLTTMETGLVVPEASVLYDMHGTAWVYEDLGGHAYARRRIEIARHWRRTHPHA